MAKEIAAYIRLQVPAGQANPGTGHHHPGGHHGLQRPIIYFHHQNSSGSGDD